MQFKVSALYLYCNHVSVWGVVGEILRQYLPTN